MSLKAFHIVFITASVLLSFGFSGWLFNNFANGGGWLNLLAGAGSGLAGLGLLYYGKFFLKKFKRFGYI